MFKLILKLEKVSIEDLILKPPFGQQNLVEMRKYYEKR